MIARDKVTLWRRGAATLLLLLLLGFYSHFRQRWVGACDWYGYFAEAQLFAQGRLDMPLKLDVARYPAAAPLSFESFNGRAVSQYPPGFPLLLAAGMQVGAELFVAPLCAVLSVWLLYLLLARRVSRLTAGLFSVMWAVSPIVVWSAGSIMSDLPAALGLMATIYFFDREKPTAAGLAFALAVAIRPTNALFGLLLLTQFRQWRTFSRFAIPAALGGSVYGLYNWHLFGAPWRTGYSYATSALGLSVFGHHFAFYGIETLRQVSPLILLPALWAVIRKKNRSLFLLGWFLLFWLFYSFWEPGADAWWYTRFLLPGFPALFLLGAQGWEEIRATVERAAPRLAAGVRVAMVLLAASLVVFYVRFDRHERLFSGQTGKAYWEAAQSALGKIPPEALVGSFETSGALRLYGGFETFRVIYPGADVLVRDALAGGRRVFIVVEPGIRRNPMMVDMLAAYETAPPIPLDGWAGLFAVELRGARRKLPVA
ncbi:MAG TPA: hypothetical protein PLS53_13885 [Thermoanaerobaculaceae bacterium]|nr:hypothetical protein [Thermoanaerobaculaceae bacterium]